MQGNIPLMETKLEEQILMERESQQSLETVLRTMKVNLIERFYDFDVRELMISWSHKLSDACQQLIEESIAGKCRQQTISRDNAASKQLMNFSEYDLTCNSQRFLNHLALLTRYKRSNIVRFYHKLMRKFPYLRLKVLPINLNLYSFTFQRKILNISDVKALVIKLWNKKQFIRATDVWMVVCMGMRKSELLPLYFQNTEGNYFRMIKIFENKNNNTTIRCIPFSLSILISLSKAEYPIDQDRFIKTRDICLKELGQFYGLRHVCLTNLVIALLETSQLSIHKRSSTTIERYIDVETTQLINKAFFLPQFEKLSSNKLNFTDTYPFIDQERNINIISNSIKEEIALTPETQQWFVEDANIDAVLSDRLDAHFLKSQEIDTQEKLNFFERQYVYENYGQEMLEQNFKDYQQVVSSILDKAKIDQQALHQYEIFQSQTTRVKSKLKLISEVLNVNIDTLNFVVTENNEHQQVIVCEKTGEIKSSKADSLDRTIVITQSKGFMKLGQSVQQLIPINREKNDILSASQQKNVQIPVLRKTRNCQKTNKKEYHFTSGTPFCEKCLKFLTLSVTKDNNFFLKCNYCKKNYQSKDIKSKLDQGNLQFYDRINIQPINSRFSTKFNSSIKAINKNNNFKKVVEEAFGVNSYLNRNCYSEEFPKNITIQMNFHSAATQKEILYNRQNEEFLPLEIRKSQITSAGLGIFAKKEIKKNQLIITYSGVIRTHYSANPQNNSLFILGSMHSTLDYETPLEVLLEPDSRLNAGRFINCGSTPQMNNAQSILGLIKNDFGQTQICIYLYAIKDIHEKEELFYSYGEFYGPIVESNSRHQ